MSDSMNVSTVVPILPGILGGIEGDSGALIVLRNNGDEGLFLSGNANPLKWVRIEEFTPNPAGVLSASELRKRLGLD